MIRTLILASTLMFAGNASATLWHIDNVPSGTDNGAFGYSLLHSSSASNPMSGSTVASITGGSGTYDDETGIVDFDLVLTDNELLNFDGILAFDTNTGALSANSTLAYSYTGSNITDLSSNGDFGFLPGFICCNAAEYPPNSLLPDNSGSGLQFMTLWGANYNSSLNFNGSPTFSGNYDPLTSTGMDLRLELSAVPVPAAVYLFGSAILGLFGWSRRKVII